MTIIDVVAVFVGIIDLGNEDDVGILCLDLWNDPSPEGAWHHFCHITTESVNALACPEQEYVEHLEPCGRGGSGDELVRALIVNAIVELDCFVPVVFTCIGSETIVARHLGRHFYIVSHLFVME